MIPNFKTYIGESIWNDIRRRGIGSDRKQEDDIENLDRDEMVEYIYSIYDANKSVNASSVIKSNTTKDTEFFSLAVFLYGSALYRLTVRYNSGKIYKIVLLANKRECDWLYDDLDDNFELTILENTTIEIKSKDSTVSNKLVLEIIDIINKAIEKASTHNILKPMLIKK